MKKVGIYSLLLGCTLPVTLPVVAEDRCLIGTWQLESESGEPAGRSSDEASFTQSGSLSLVFKAELAPGEDRADRRELLIDYGKYQTTRYIKVNVVSTTKRLSMNGKSQGYWSHPGDGQLQLHFKDKLDASFAMKTRLPNVPERPWQDMGSQSMLPPHHSAYQYSCDKSKLVLRKAAHPGLSVNDYLATFKRR